MPLPTLLQKGSLRAIDPADQTKLDNIVAIDYVMDWFRKRVDGNLNGIINRVLILKSDTGSGKTTAVPPYLYDNFWKKGMGWIGVTQPRVLTAITNVKEIAISNSKNYPSMRIGETIGWLTGPSKKKTANGVVFMTIGVLTMHLKLLTDDEMMKKYKFIILDEIHELSVEMAQAIYLIKRFLFRNANNPNLPFVVCTSATMDTDKYLAYFQVPKETNLIMVAGFAYEKTEHWLPIISENYLKSAKDVVEQIHTTNLNDDPEKSDILIFLPGIGEIEQVERHLNKLNEELTIKNIAPILPLKIDRGAIQSNNQDYIRTFIPANKLKVFVNNQRLVPIRKVILSTVVAETGLTLDTLKYVIDSGYNRSTEFYPTIGASGLLTKPVSHSRVKQRMGRAGRKFPGEFWPLYPKEIFDKMMEQQYSDLVLSEFTSVLLNIMATEEERFSVSSLDMIDLVSPDSVHHALEKCYLLGFYSPKSRQITELGKLADKFSMLSVENIRMVLAGYFWGVNILDLVTIATYMQMDTRDFTGKMPIDWINIYKKSAPEFIASAKDSAIFKIKMLIADDFIDGIFLYNAIANIIKNSNDANFYGTLLKWCVQVNINFTGIVEFIKQRDELIEQMLNLQLDVFGSNQTQPYLLDLDETKFIDQIIKIKYCIYDGYRINTAVYNSTIGEYEIAAGRIKTPALFSDRELQMALKEKYGIDRKMRPKYILYDNLDLKYNRKTLMYEIKTGRISTMDGFVQMDSEFV